MALLVQPVDQNHWEWELRGGMGAEKDFRAVLGVQRSIARIDQVGTKPHSNPNESTLTRSLLRIDQGTIGSQ